jgi:hypothetical protein
MVAIIPGSGDINMGKTISGNEYSFYSNYSPSVNSTEEERTLYTILQQKVAYGGIESLNKTGMHSKGVVYNQQNSAMRLDGGSLNNPHISPTMADATKWAGGRSLTPVAGKPGLYQDQAWAGTPYVFVLQTPGSRTKTQTYVPKKNSTVTPPPFVLPKPPPWTGPKSILPKQPVKKKIPQEYDLLFNTLDYTKSYNEEIQKLTMELISAGDDLLTNYTYESIDFLPDVDIEVKTQSGEYVNSRTIFQQTERSQYLESIIDDSETSEEINLANELITYIESKISTRVTFAERLKYYGSIDNSGKFKKGVPTQNKVDFYLEIPEKFRDLDIEIRFDRI